VASNGNLERRTESFAEYVRERLANHLQEGGSKPTPRAVVRALLAPPLPPYDYVDAVVEALLPEVER
jgi:hypothetical protein